MKRYCVPVKDLYPDDIFFYRGKSYSVRGTDPYNYVVVSPYENEFLFYCISPLVQVYHYAYDKPYSREVNLPNDLDCPF